MQHYVEFSPCIAASNFGQLSCCASLMVVSSVAQAGCSKSLVHRHSGRCGVSSYYFFWRRDMSRLRMIVRSFVKNDEAATMVEYALMLALIAVVCIAAVVIIGSQANLVFTNISDQLTAAA
jgi:pilus assembly protein Flp/PilA